ncbi:MAG: stage II sporulation protein M [Oscillospiraceae bacterium]|nr:stage II sporulation protein M [Oscillospiraceae bacterium]
MEDIKTNIKQSMCFLKNHVYGMFITCMLCFIAMTVLFHFLNLDNPEFVQKTVEELAQTLAKKGADSETGGVNFTSLLLNNLMVSLIAVSWGAVPFVFLSTPVLATNAIAISVMSAHFVLQGKSMAIFFAGLLPHGIFEIPALVLSVAMGLAISLNSTIRIFKDENTLSFSEMFLTCMKVYAWIVVPLMLLSAITEVYITPHIMKFFA